LTGVSLTLLLVACQAGGAVTPPSNAPAATPAGAIVPEGGAEPTRLSGTITYDMDSTNGSGGSSTDIHRHLAANVSLVVQDADHPFTFVDNGSTFTYTETATADDPQTVSSCGSHRESSASGSGPFASPGKIVASYSDYSPTADLIIKAPYTSSSSLKFLCNGLTSSDTTSDATEGLECNTGGTGELEGTIEPGGVEKIAPGQVVDFTCTEEMVIGSGSVKVTGSLTSN
jgi:hypothetical protein